MHIFFPPMNHWNTQPEPYDVQCVCVCVLTVDYFSPKPKDNCCAVHRQIGLLLFLVDLAYLSPFSNLVVSFFNMILQIANESTIPCCWFFFSNGKTFTNQIRYCCVIKSNQNLPRQGSLSCSSVTLAAFDFVVPSWVFVRTCKPIYHCSSGNERMYV